MKKEIKISRGIVNAKKRKENEMNTGPTEEASFCEEENFLDLQIAETKGPTYSLNHSKLKPLMRGFDSKELIRKFKEAILFDDVDEQDSEKAICLGSKTTKKQFSCAIDDWKNEYFISDDALDSLLKILNNSLGEFVYLRVKVRSNYMKCGDLVDVDILSLSPQDLQESKVASNIEKYTHEKKYISMYK